MLFIVLLEIGKKLIQNLINKVQKQYPKLERHHVRALLAYVLSTTPEYLMLYPNLVIDQDASHHFMRLVKELVAGKPLSRIMGRREFWGLTFQLSDETLDPRPDSETLIESVIKMLPDRALPLHILDLGTGTGCLLVALLSEYKNAKGVAVDQSQDALRTAQSNAETNGVGNRFSICQSHWFQNVDGVFDLIVSNPPYISEKDYEALDDNVKNYDPKKALLGGDDGLSDYKTIIKHTPHFLKEKGFLVLEMGYGQCSAITKLLHKSHLKNISVFKDLAGIDRCVLAQRNH